MSSPSILFPVRKVHRLARATLARASSTKMSKREEPSGGHAELKHPDTKRAKQIDADTPYHRLQQKLDD